MTNALTYPQSFARVLQVQALEVDLAFELDHALWPWLSLPAWHPVLLEKYQYFGATAASLASGLFDAQAHTALTCFRWHCNDELMAGSYPTHARCTQHNNDTSMGFTLDLKDTQGKTLCRSSGEGFLFSDRDFQKWRSNTRQQALAASKPSPVPPSAPVLCGLGEDGHSFIGISIINNLQGEVGQQAGFHPRHPFHTGSGDHVNAAQILDCALQAAHLHAGDGHAWAQPLRVLGGECQFKRYLELDIPFAVEVERDEKADTLVCSFHQAGHFNCRIKLLLQATTVHSKAD